MPRMFLPEQSRRVRLGQGRFEARDGLAQEFAANVVVAHGRRHRIAADRHALDHRMRVVAQNVAIVAGAGLGFVRIAHGVFLHRRGARHEAPFHARRKCRAAPAAQPRRFDLLDDFLARRLLAQDLLPRLVAAELRGSPRASRAARASALRTTPDSARKPLTSPAQVDAHFNSSKILSMLSGVRFSWYT